MSIERHDIYEADAAPYLLGALTEIEVQRFEAHVEECPVCRDEVDRLRPAVEALPRSAPPVRPSPGLKASLMEIVDAEGRERGTAPASSPEAEPQRSRPGAFARLRERLGSAGDGWTGARPALASVSIAFVLFVGGLAGYAGTQLKAGDEDTSRTLAAQADEERFPSGSGSLVVHSSGEDGGVLRVHGMPPLDRDSVYQVWVRRGGELISQSMFSVGENGEGAAAVPDDLREADAVSVTREDRGGAKAPSENPVLTVPL